MKHPLCLIAVFIFSCLLGCNFSRESNGSEQNENIEQNIFFPIEHFLFLKKGIKINAVVEYLKSNKIEYKIVKHRNWNDSIFSYKIPNECVSVLFVYNLKIVDSVIDELKIYFIENQIFTLQYRKGAILFTDIGISGNETNKAEVQEELMQFVKSNIGIMKFLYRGLLDKYGSPTLTQKSSEDYFVESIPYFPDNDSTREIKKIFDVYWNERSIDKYPDSVIRIRMSNQFSRRKKSDFSYYIGQTFQYDQLIEVDFTNKSLIRTLDSCNEFKVILEPHPINTNDIKLDKLKKIL
jgi:hypothetical protein